MQGMTLNRMNDVHWTNAANVWTAYHALSGLCGFMVLRTQGVALGLFILPLRGLGVALGWFITPLRGLGVAPGLSIRLPRNMGVAPGTAGVNPGQTL